MGNLFYEIKKFIYKIKDNEYVQAFLILLGLALLVFCSMGFTNNFTIPMSGDYVLQTYAFYSQGYNNFWEFINSGKVPMFDFSNFLGANYYGTMSFYYVFSPLFYILCLWPSKYIFQGIFFNLLFKYALSGFFFYILLRKYHHVSHKSSILGAFAFAFSGFSIFYIWFHYSDIVALFPLFLIGIEKCLKERKGWVLTLSIFLYGITNYFFEVNFAIFGVFYAFYRWIAIYGINKKMGYDAKTRWGALLQGVLCYGAGLLLTGFVLFPSLFVASQSDRNQSYFLELLEYFFVSPTQEDTGKYILGEFKSFKELFDFENLKGLFNYLFLWPSSRTHGSAVVTPAQQNGYIISNWLFMTTNCWTSTSFNMSTLDNSIGGFFISTPLEILLVPSIIRAFKTKRPWTIFGVIAALLIPFLPITFYLAFGFTSNYGRWEIWIAAISIIFIIKTFDNLESVNRKWISVGLIINYLLAAFIINLSVTKTDVTPGKDFMIVMAIEVGAMLLVWALYRFKFFTMKRLKQVMTVLVIVEIGASFIVTVAHKGFYKWDEYYYSSPSYANLQDAVSYIKENDDSFYRIYNSETIRSFVNMPSTLSYNGSSTFHSTYNFEQKDFIKRSRVWYNGGWTMGMHEKRYYLDQYIGIKYYIIDKNDLNNDNGDSYRDLTDYFDGRGLIFDYDNLLVTNDDHKQDYDINMPWGYKLFYENDQFAVYENENFIGIGYLVNEILRDSIGTSNRSSVYEQAYTKLALVPENTFESLSLLYKDSFTTHNNMIDGSYTEVHQNAWDTYFSLRESYEEDKVRKLYKLDTQTYVSKEEIEAIIPENSSMIHKRWEQKEQYGDMIVLKHKTGSVCPLATDDNKCFINLNFKMGPRALISLYSDGELVTQDAHMAGNSQISKENYEWKCERGFYVNKPIDQIVIEFICDLNYEQVFNSSGRTGEIKMYYQYQDEVEETYSKIMDNLLYDVTYNTNSFDFKAKSDTTQIAVTNIPYDAGWSLIEDGNEKSIIKVNGGFVGFLVQGGSEHTYTLSYFTPKLIFGFYFTLGGLILSIALFFIYRKTKIDILEREEKQIIPYVQNKKEQTIYHIMRRDK